MKKSPVSWEAVASHCYLHPVQIIYLKVIHSLQVTSNTMYLWISCSMFFLFSHHFHTVLYQSVAQTLHPLFTMQKHFMSGRQFFMGLLCFCMSCERHQLNFLWTIFSSKDIRITNSLGRYIFPSGAEEKRGYSPL